MTRADKFSRAGTLALLAMAGVGVAAWPDVALSASIYSVERSSTAVNFNMIRGEETADYRGGSFSSFPAKAGDDPAYAYGDWFDGSDSIRYDNVNLNLSAGSYLSLLARTQFSGTGTYQLQLFTPGSNYTNPVATYDATRFRQTFFGRGTTPLGDPGWTYVPFATDLSGTYDVQITNTSGGAHIAGIGAWTPRELTAGTQTLTAENFDWADGGKSYYGPASNSVGQYLDNEIGYGSWLDYDVYNPDGATTYTASVFFRQQTGGDVTFYVQDVGLDGTVTNLTSIILPSTSWGGPFQDSSISASFVLPQGISSLRVSTDKVIHYNYTTLTATPVPEPSAVALGLAGLGGLALLRRQRVRLAAQRA